MQANMKLTDLNLIEALETPEYKPLYNIFHERTFSKKQVISMPDHEEDLVLLVKSGRIKVFLAYEDKEFTLSILEKGDVFTTHTRAFTQALDDDTVVLMTSTSKFGQILATVPQLSLIMVKVLGDLLKNSITIINGLVFKEAHSRLAEFLVQAAETKGEVIEGKIKLNLGLNVEEIGNIIGTRRQTVSVLLNDLYKNAILEKEGRQSLIIKNMDLLKEVIND